MAQIPLFNQSQRLEPGSPVAGVSPEGAADALYGRAQAQFGKALFDVGNVLDRAAKSTQGSEDDLTAVLIERKAREHDVLIRLQMAGAAVDMNENPNGSDSAKSYFSRMDEFVAGAVAGTNENVQRKVFAKVGAWKSESASKVAVGVLDKRETNLGLLRQEALGRYSVQVRSDDRMVVPAMDEWETMILEDATIADAKKPGIIAAGKQSMAREAVRGAIDRAKGDKSVAGSSKTFDSAEKMVKDKFGLIFDDAMKNKLQDEVRTERSAYFSTLNTTYNIETKMLETEMKTETEKSEYKWQMQMIGAAANSDKAAKVRGDILRDTTVSQEFKNSMFTNQARYAEVSNDTFEAEFNEKLYTGKFTTRTLLDNVRKARIDGRIDDSRQIQLQRKVAELADKNTKNPGIPAVIAGAKNEIISAWGRDPFDIEAIMYKGQSGQELAQAVSSFAGRVSRLYAANAVTESSISAAKIATMREFNKPYLNRSQGVGAGGQYAAPMKDTTQIDRDLKALKLDMKKNGATYSPEVLRARTKQAQNLINNKKALDFSKMLEFNSDKPSSRGSKPVGD